MPTPSELRKIRDARMRDAQVLFKAKRYAGAKYLCGYVIELSLKARICRTLGWVQFPPGKRDDYRSFIIHDLDTLLRLSGRDRKIRSSHMALWSIVNTWNPEQRYNPTRTVGRKDAFEMIESSKALMKVL